LDSIGSAAVGTAERATGKGSRMIPTDDLADQAPAAGGAQSRVAGGRVMIGSASDQLVPRLRGVSHAVASVVAVAAAVVVVALAPTARTIVAPCVYGAGLIALFGASALYHRWPGPPRFKPLLQQLDHSTIYAFIAASYTPIAVLLLHGTLAWMILVVAWAGAAAGVTFTLGWIKAPRAVVTASYLALGWIAVIAVPQLLQLLSPVPLVLLGAGGLLYSAGAIVYATRRPDPWPRTFGFHEVFHALVILAAAAQYVAIVGWVLPGS
jgi:hemolysin III